MDLLIKKVLHIQEIVKKPHHKDTFLSTYNYAQTGKNFNNYKPRKHEAIFLAPFKKNTEIQILFKQFIKLIYQSSNNLSTYHRLIKKN
ncbi:hypothetical protein N9595_02875 [Bacteroidia bacterium]|nr:hypothetical protein [Bacteroidia bacterium]